MQIKPFAETTKHGTVNAYTNYGCRCDHCKAAMAKKIADYRQRRRENRETLVKMRVAKPSQRAFQMMADWMRTNAPDAYESIMNRTNVRYGL